MPLWITACADTAWLQNSKKRAERSEIDVWAESLRLFSALVICIIVCLSWAVNHYRDNAITYKAQRDKNARELKLANAAITDMQMRQRDVAALDAKYTKELVDAKAENDALRDDVAAGRRRLHIKAVCQSVQALPPPAGIKVAFPTGRHRWTGLFHPQREADQFHKQLEGTQKILTSSADRVAHNDGQLMQLLWAIHTRFQRSINA